MSCVRLTSASALRIAASSLAFASSPPPPPRSRRPPSSSTSSPSCCHDLAGQPSSCNTRSTQPKQPTILNVLQPACEDARLHLPAQPRPALCRRRRRLRGTARVLITFACRPSRVARGLISSAAPTERLNGAPLPAFAPGHSEATPRPQAEDEAERYLLVLRFLEGSPCTAAFEALKREAAEHGLLGSQTDWTGASRPTSYERELDRRAPNLPSEHLSQLLDMVQRLSREREPVETRLSAAPRSLLRQGTLSLVEPCAALPAGPRVLASRNEHLPRTSLAWSARLSPAVPLPDMLRRGDRVRWLGLGKGGGLRV